MSGQPTVNIVDDDKMSSQGNVDAPVAVPKIEAQVQPAMQTQYVLPSGLPLWPQSLIVQVAPTTQSSVFVGPSGAAPTLPVAGGNVQPTIMTPTIPVEVLSC